MMNNPRYRHLDEAERLQICDFIRAQVLVAKDEEHVFRKFARWQISLLLWRWTADAYCQWEDVIRPDAIKYNVEMVPATKKARELRKRSIRGLRHEHCVPRIVLTDLIIKGDLSTDQIYKLLARHCRAVIVTQEEDQKLSEYGKKTMGEGWEWETGCPYDRYRAAGLLDEIDWKGAAHDCPEDSVCRQA